MKSMTRLEAADHFARRHDRIWAARVALAIIIVLAAVGFGAWFVWANAAINGPVVGTCVLAFTAYVLYRLVTGPVERLIEPADTWLPEDFDERWPE